MIQCQRSYHRQLDNFKKEYGRKRRTVVENAEEAVFEEKKIEEQEVVFLMDRFGYSKTVDVSVYERNKKLLMIKKASMLCIV